MKTLLKDPVSDLNLKTISPGLQRWNNKKENTYRFYWVNSTNKVVVVSEKYSTTESRNRDFKNIQKGQFEIALVEKEALFYFQILDNNQEKIASSVSFLDEKTCQKTKLAFETKYIDKKPKEKKSKQKTAKDLVTQISDISVRQSFRLVFYKRSDTLGDWHGLVSHALSKKQTNISGVNDPKLSLFINEHLNQPADETIDQNVDENNRHEIEWVDLDKIYQLGDPLQLKWTSKKGTILKKKVYEAKLEAKSITDNQIALIGRTQSRLELQDELLLDAKTNGMNTGLYRLTATLTDNSVESGLLVAEESRLVLFV